MIKTLIYLLKCFASLSVGLGLYHFLNFKFENAFENAAILIILLCVLISFVVIFTTLKGKRKIEIPLLIFLLILGLAMSSMYGHGAFLKNKKASSISISIR